MKKIKALLRKIKTGIKKMLPASVVRFVQRIKKTAKGKLGAVKKKIDAYRSTSTYLSAWDKQPIDPFIILYESHGGIGLTCNPYAIFRAFLQHDTFMRYTHVWSLDSDKKVKRLQELYAKYPNVHFVRRNSPAYQRHLATAGRLINNSTFPYYFAKRTGQQYMNTWHSITVKTLGFDIPQDGPALSANILRNLLMTDQLLSANDFMTDIFARAYKLRGLYAGALLETGSPRNDLVTQTDRDFLLEKLEFYGVRLDPNKKIILYAPTWKGKDHLKPAINLSAHRALQDAILEHLDADTWQVIIKPHPVEFNKSTPAQRRGMTLVPPSIDINELLSITDVLISDYSSVYFDFLLTDRPILFYIPDLVEYSQYRGVYFSIDELPGPAVDTIDALVDHLLDLDAVRASYRERYVQTRAWACAHDDGHVGERIVNAMVRDDFSTFPQRSLQEPKKKKLLLSMSRLNMNGVTTTGLKLLDSIDYDRYDVTMLVLPNKDPMAAQFRTRINPNVRALFLVGRFYRTPREQFDYRATSTQRFPRLSHFPQKAFRREAIRIFGDAYFDCAIDFSGYMYYDASIISQVNAGKRLIWQHSDAMKDMTNTKKKSTHGQNLRAIAKHLHTRFDGIVSASFYIMGENMENMATPDTIGKFTYASNLVDEQRILAGIGPKEYMQMDGNLYYKLPETSPQVRHLRRLPAPNECAFVMTGRLSSEKNQANLIRAFARLHKEYPHTKLYFIGDGILKNSLTKLVGKLKLTQSVFLLGSLMNPFAIMAKCQCFIFPSLYESQGLGVMEARVLGMPIIISNYDAVDSVTMPGGQLLIGHSEEDIYQGMRVFVRGEADIHYTFDVEAYNRNALAEFERLLG